MATNRDLLKEAIADAKTVKNMAIANAKAALEESFTPHLTTMLSAKIQEMDEFEEEEEKEEVVSEKCGYTHKVDEDLDEVDLDELLSELDEGEDEDAEEAKDDAEEAEEDADEAEDEADEAEDEALDLEDMTEEDFKKFVEDVIADMVETGELEAGEGAEGEEVEGEEGEIEIGMEDEEEVDIDELIAEIDSLEEDGFGKMSADPNVGFSTMEEKALDEDLEEGVFDFLKKKEKEAPKKDSGPKLVGVDFDGNYIYSDDPNISDKSYAPVNEDEDEDSEEEKEHEEGAIRDDRDHIRDLDADAEADEKKLKKLKKEGEGEMMTEDLKAWWERFKGSLGIGKLGEFNTEVLKWMQTNEKAIEGAKDSPQKGQDILKSFTKEMKSTMDKPAFDSDRSSLMKVLGLSDTEGETGHAGGGTYSESLQRENRILRSKLKEVKAANGVLNSELREINLLNSKLLYTNKIFKGKNLTEGQKVKVLSTFDKASNVKEVKLIFETIKDSFKTTKRPINENYGSASRMLRSTGNKKPIIPVDDAFKRMQELAFYDQKH